MTAGYLLDTNVFSELPRRAPDAHVLRWISACREDELFVSSISIGELIRGVFKPRDAAQREALAVWAGLEIPRRFDGRVVAFDRAAGALWGRLMGEADRQGRPRPAIDMQVAAISLSQNLTLVTRNTRDFDGLGLRLINPWTEAAP